MCNVPVSGESREIQHNSLDHNFGSPASKMSRSVFHQEEPGAAGSHTDCLISNMDFPARDESYSDGQWNCYYGKSSSEQGCPTCDIIAPLRGRMPYSRHNCYYRPSSYCVLTDYNFWMMPDIVPATYVQHRCII